MTFQNIFIKGILPVGLAASFAVAAIDISVDASQGIKKISPYIYGRNIDGISDTDPTVSSDEQKVINQMLDAGIHFMRANNGNNATRYNWRKKMTVHPDWYSNVYDHDWGITAKKIQENLPGVDAMYAFQLIGYAASTTDNNFPDYAFYLEHGEWANRELRLCGGGEVADD